MLEKSTSVVLVDYPWCSPADGMVMEKTGMGATAASGFCFSVSLVTDLSNQAVLSAWLKKNTKQQTHREVV